MYMKQGPSLAGFEVVGTSDVVPVLEPSVKTDSICRIHVPPDDIDSLEISIRAVYEYPVPFHMQDCWGASFTGVRTVNHRFLWIYHGASHCSDAE